MRIIKNLLEYFNASATWVVYVGNAISNFFGSFVAYTNQDAKPDIILEDIINQEWEAVEQIEDRHEENPHPITFLSPKHQKEAVTQSSYYQGRLSINQLEAAYSLLSPEIAECDPNNVLSVTANFNRIYNDNKVRYYSFTNSNNQNIILTQPVVISENDIQVEMGASCLATVLATYKQRFADTTFRLIIPIAEIIKSKIYLPDSRHFTTLVIDKINQEEDIFQATLIDPFSKSNVASTYSIYKSRDSEIISIVNDHLNGVTSHKREFLNHQSRTNDYANCGRFVIMTANHLINCQQELTATTIPQPSSKFIPATSKKWLTATCIQLINDEIKRLYQINKECQRSIGEYFLQLQPDSSSTAIRQQCMQMAL